MSLASLGVAAAGIRPFHSFAKKLSDMNAVVPPPTGGPGKYSRESLYYVLTPKGVKCQLCPNQCVLKDGQEGLCRNHVAYGEKLYSIAFGNPCSVHIDPIEKKPLFHYLPSSESFSIATAGCTLACLNCQNWEISQVSPRTTKNVEMYPAQVVQEAASNGCKTIAYTYSEPLSFYEYTYETSKLARARGLKNLLISNGYINEKPLRELAKCLDAANINLKSFREDIYAKLNGGSLEPILRTLKILKEEGVWLEITNLIVPGWTDKMDMVKEMCEWLVENGFSDYPLHFSRFFPLYKLTSIPYTPLSTLEQAYNIARKAGINYVYIGNVPGTDYENTYCPKCRKLSVERRGFTVTANNIKNGNCGFCSTRINGIWT
ncbi:MAG: AmmeMemoRadiSam system radical SAM enzyme [Bacteroidetes bacterium]|nr:AmmeMemoRadiSam system radical SAM enzyme [Bacteroidota bacterium]